MRNINLEEMMRGNERERKKDEETVFLSRHSGEKSELKIPCPLWGSQTNLKVETEILGAIS